MGKTARTDEIKKAYLELAKKCHPDLSCDEDAHTQFQTLSNAFTLLTDTEARKAYESGRMDGGDFKAKDGNANSNFWKIFDDLRFRKTGSVSKTMENMALEAVLELQRGNQVPARDFVVRWRMPPQYCLPNR